MIALQVVAALLLLLLSIPLVLFYFLYIQHRAFLLTLFVLFGIYSTCLGVVFLSPYVGMGGFLGLLLIWTYRRHQLHRVSNVTLNSNDITVVTMFEEKKMILGMLKEDKISIDEAALLLDKTNSSPGDTSSAKEGKTFRVLVVEEDVTKVSINIPLKLAQFALQFVPKDALQIEGQMLDADSLLGMIDSTSEGELVNIDTMDKGKSVKVRVCVE